MTKRSLAFLPLAALLAAGCSGSDEVAAGETKPSEVRQNIDPATQDRIAADLKTWKPQK